MLSIYHVPFWPAVIAGLIILAIGFICWLIIEVKITPVSEEFPESEEPQNEEWEEALLGEEETPPLKEAQFN